MSGDTMAETEKLAPAASTTETPQASETAQQKPAEQQPGKADAGSAEPKGEGADPQAQTVEANRKLDELTAKLTADYKDPSAPPSDDELLEPTEDERRWMGSRNAKRFDRLKELHKTEVEALKPSAEVGKRVIEVLEARKISVDDLLAERQQEQEPPKATAGIDLTALRDLAKSIELSASERDAVDLDFMSEEDARLLAALRKQLSNPELSRAKEAQAEKPVADEAEQGKEKAKQESQEPRGGYTDADASVDIEDYLIHDAGIPDEQLESYMDELLPEIAKILEKTGRVDAVVDPRDKVRLVRQAHREVQKRSQNRQPGTRDEAGRFKSGGKVPQEQRELSADEQWLAELDPASRARISRLISQ